MAATRTHRAVPEAGKARRTYETLVAATRTSIDETGTFSAETVAERAGVATATFYTYFSSKDDALAAAFDAVLRELNEETAGGLGIEALLDGSLVSLMRDLVRTVVHVFRDNALVFRLAVARLPESKTIRAVYRERQREGRALLERFLELGAAAGRIRSDAGADVATALLVTLQGYNNPLLLGRPRPAVLDELARPLVALLEPR